MTPEKKVKNKVVAILKTYECYYFYPVATGWGSSGVPDIVACLDGHFIGIEVKADMKKNRPTTLQQKHLDEIKAKGGVSMVVDANSLNDLVGVLEALRYGKRQ
jgi:hypothetical protein